MILVPGADGNVHLLHHGFGSNTVEGFGLFFFHGNLSDCAAVRTIPRKEAVAGLITSTQPQRGRRRANVGAKTLKARKLAYDITQFLHIDDSDDEDVTDLNRAEAGVKEPVLAFLWAIAKGNTTPIARGDMPEDPTLKKTVRSFRKKAEGRSARHVSMEASPARGVTQEGAEAMALSSQTILPNDGARP
jgi:hypothetical protein